MANPLLKQVRREHPPFLRAVAADTRCALAYRAEPFEFDSRLRLLVQTLRLCWVADSFLALVLYRARARLERFRVPIVPTVLHRLSMIHSQVCIGSPVSIQPGVYLAHGQVVIDGFTRIGPGVVVFPWVTVGLKAGNFQGPTIERGVHLGTGSKIIGQINIGQFAVIGANSVVVDDVPSGETFVGIPARRLVRADSEQERE